MSTTDTKRQYFRKTIKLDELPKEDISDLHEIAKDCDCLNIEEYMLKVLIPHILEIHRAKRTKE